MENEQHSAPRRADSATSPADSLREVVQRVIDAADEQTVTLRRIFEAFGDASFAPILLLPALAVATPLSGIPFFSSVMGVLICVISLQMLARRRDLWLPDWALRRSVSGQTVQTAFTKLLPLAHWVDQRTNRRLRYVVRRPFIVVPQLICAASGAVMPILEFVPFSSSIMGFGIAALALGMLAKDGIVILLGLVPYAVIFAMVRTAVA